MPKVSHQKDIHNNVVDKQDELKKKLQVYNSKRIQEIIENNTGDGKPDTTPFFHGKSDWRDAGVIFEYTDEELEELDKCSSDCEYFVSNYCKFLNKKGRTLVKLRDYQKRLLNVMGGEHWDPDEEIIMPDHSDIVLLQSRLTGKCLAMNSSIKIFKDNMDILIKLYELYYNISKKKLIDKILYILFKLNEIIHIPFIIFLFQLIKYGKHDKKIIETIYTDNIKVKSINGYNNMIEFHITKPFSIYFIYLKNGLFLYGADEHLVYSDINNGDQGWHFIKDLSNNDFVFTEFGWQPILFVHKTIEKEYMCDITLKNDNEKI